MAESVGGRFDVCDEVFGSDDMAEFYVNGPAVLDAAKSLNSLADKLTKITNSLNNANRMLPGTMTKFQPALSAKSNEIAQYSSFANKANTVLKEAHREYYRAEKAITGQQSIRSQQDGDRDIKSVFGRLTDLFGNRNWQNWSLGALREKLLSLDEAALAGSIGNTFRQYTSSGGTDWGHYNADAAIGTAEAHWDWRSSIYDVDENGNKRINPKIDASVGGSYTLLSLAADGRVGNDLLNAHGSADVVVGKVEAAGKLSAALRNEDGLIDPSLNVKLSAEAVAIKAEAKAGVTVLGAEANISGSVYVGVGAHADIGIKDGVLKFDVGAALGVGASVSFEIKLPFMSAKKGTSVSFWQEKSSSYSYSQRL